MRTETLRAFREILEKKHARLQKRLSADPEKEMRDAHKQIKSLLEGDPELPWSDTPDSIESLVFRIAGNRGLASLIVNYEEASRTFKNLERHREEWEKEAALLMNDIIALDAMIEKVESPLLHQEGVKD